MKDRTCHLGDNFRPCAGGVYAVEGVFGKGQGLEALSARSRRPLRYASQLPQQFESLIVTLKRKKPHWGARKICELLFRRLDHNVRIPAGTIIHALMPRYSLVEPPGRPRRRANAP
jgi:hypothetical protein